MDGDAEAKIMEHWQASEQGGSAGRADARPSRLTPPEPSGGRVPLTESGPDRADP